MKGFKALLVALAVMSFAVTASFAGRSQCSPANTPCPVFDVNGNQNTVTVAMTAAAVSTACVANAARMAGYVVNVSTNYLLVSFTSNVPATIASSYFLVYPTADSYGRDRLPLNLANNIYQGAIYFYAVESDLSTKGAGKISYYEWK